MRIRVGDEVVDVRYYREAKDYERACGARLASLAPWIRLDSIAFADVNSPVPEGYAVLGVCVKDGYTIVKITRGDTALTVMHTDPAYDQLWLLPSPILGPARAKPIIHGDNSSIILVDLYKLLKPNP